MLEREMAKRAGRGAAQRPKPEALPKRISRAADSVDKVYEAVKRLAVDYRFKPGERINEVELAGRLRVSRTPVREALNRLAGNGFMSFVPNRGFYARDITPESVRELYELRAAIERSAFRLACIRGAAKEIDKAVDIWERRTAGDASQDWARVSEADEAFHMSIARMSGNTRMVAALEEINHLIRFFRRIDIETPCRRRSTYDEHAAIIACLRQRDGEKGGELIERHVTMSSEHAMAVTKEGLARIFFGRAA